jgi:nitrogen fixation/metabolism regulation signal transduction histidine kinase
MVALFLLLLVSLYALGNTAESLERFGRLYVWLLAVNALGLVFIAVLIGVNTWNLISEFRRNAAGSRLTARLVVMFVVLTLVPVTIVFSFSVKFLQSGIDSWFDVRVEEALENALELSRDSLGAKMRNLQRVTQNMTERLVDVESDSAVVALNDLRVTSGASELTLLTLGNRVIASSSEDAADVVPARPDEGILAQVRNGQPYVGLDPIEDSGLHLRVVVTVLSADPAAENRILQALYPVADRINELADVVQVAFQKYQQLTYLRQPLKVSFILTLSLVLLLSVLSAVWVAFQLARRLMSPIHELAEGTQAVAAGNYSTRLSPSGRDELGFVVRSFNDMTRRLAGARDAARISQQLVESQRTYLEAVLGRISSGVITLDMRGKLRTVNQAAINVLGVDLQAHIGQTLPVLSAQQPALERFTEEVFPHIKEGAAEWSEQIELFGAQGRRILVCRGARLPGQEADTEGYVLVFDDVTALIRAQRDAAWSEVARRLAHEIKNPLTPIQLSAERLRQKYLGSMSPAEARLLDRSTHTIVQQVETMKSMVKAFAEYANAPEVQLQQLDVNQIVSEVSDLYRGMDGHLKINLTLDRLLPSIQGDGARVRQVLVNLIKNAMEAQRGQQKSVIDIGTRHVRHHGYDYVELRIEDQGPGIDAEVLEHLYEPYVSTKPKGGGLGLAIVKKIIEEHGGMVRVSNKADGGARVVIQFPLPEGVVRGTTTGEFDAVSKVV